MRFYGFGNYYLSSLQQGLQAAHTVGELFVQNNHSLLNNASVSDYTQPKEIEQLEKADMVLEWADKHKTMVLLNGGNSAALQDLYIFFNDEDNPYPFAKFHEDEQSLNGALTYVGIILPEKIYETASKLRSCRGHFYNHKNCSIEIEDIVYTADVRSTSIIENISDFEYELCNRLNQYRLAG